MATSMTSTGRRPKKLTVRRAAAVLVAPSSPTPRELKLLSDIDDQDGFRFRVPIIQLYRRSASRDDLEPAAVLRDAVARALAHYYPLAGRLRELERRKLAVDCTADGVPFAVADADVRLDDLGDSVVHPPLACNEELFLDVAPAAESSILNSPPAHIQVTRLACGGFAVAVQVCHAVADANGILQFLEAVAELARGRAAAPTVRPVWARHLLLARDPPRPTFAHREYDDGEAAVAPPPLPLVQGFVFLGPRDVAAIRAQLAPGLRARSTAFDAVAAFLWKCRTTALLQQQLAAGAAGAEVRLGFPVSACHGDRGLRLPRGYYGNTAALPVAVSAAGDLARTRWATPWSWCARPRRRWTPSTSGRRRT